MKGKETMEYFNMMERLDYFEAKLGTRELLLQMVRAMSEKELSYLLSLIIENGDIDND